MSIVASYFPSWIWNWQGWHVHYQCKNGTELHFDLKELVVVTGLKSRHISEFVSGPSVPNRLIAENFGDFDKVPKSNFYHKFKLENFWKEDDRL